MEDASVIVSFRMPKTLNDALEECVKNGGYASKTELLREALRAQLYANISAMRGSVKGRKAPASMSDWRKKQWEEALKLSGGDARKAVALLDAKGKKALSGLKL
jgi:Arc/MetJ-type ribon-helix-helix transcriptional regulator